MIVTTCDSSSSDGESEEEGEDNEGDLIPNPIIDVGGEEEMKIAVDDGEKSSVVTIEDKEKEEEVEAITPQAPPVVAAAITTEDEKEVKVPPTPCEEPPVIISIQEALNDAVQQFVNPSSPTNTFFQQGGDVLDMQDFLDTDFDAAAANPTQPSVIAVPQYSDEYFPANVTGSEASQEYVPTPLDGKNRLDVDPCGDLITIASDLGTALYNTPTPESILPPINKEHTFIVESKYIPQTLGPASPRSGNGKTQDTSGIKPAALVDLAGHNFTKVPSPNWRRGIL